MKSLFTEVGFNLSLYCAIAFFTGWTAVLGTDEAAKYISPAALFWLRGLCGVTSGTLLAAKMFLSTSYADYKGKKDATTNTSQFVLQPAPDRTIVAGK